MIHSFAIFGNNNVAQWCYIMSLYDVYGFRIHNVIIEANERPGLANHEPQPTAERFVDLLFPQTTTS
jgi:hypothetical protein